MPQPADRRRNGRDPSPLPHVLLVGARSETLGQLVGCPVAVSVVQRPGKASAFDHEVALQCAEADVTDADAVLAAAGEIHARRPIDAVVGMTELALLPSSLVGEALGARVNPSSTVALARDKATTRRRLAHAGLDSTAHRVCQGPDDVAALLDEVQGAVVLKPVDGNGGTGVVLVQDRSEVASAWAWTSSASSSYVEPGASGNAVLAEEQLTGREYSVETMSAGGRHVVLAVTAKHTSGPPHFAELGHDMPAPLEPTEHALVTETVHRALSAIDQRWGPCHTEVMLGEGGTRATVIEINCRHGGDRIWEMVGLVTGVAMVPATVMALAHDRLPSVGAAHLQGAAVRFLSAPQGRIVSVDGLDGARTVNGVVRLGELRSPGFEVPRLSDSWGRLGYVLAAGPDVTTAAAAASRAAACVDIVTVPTHPVPDASPAEVTAGAEETRA